MNFVFYCTFLNLDFVQKPYLLKLISSASLSCAKCKASVIVSWTQSGAGSFGMILSSGVGGKSCLGW